MRICAYRNLSESAVPVKLRAVKTTQADDVPPLPSDFACRALVRRCLLPVACGHDAPQVFKEAVAKAAGHPVTDPADFVTEPILEHGRMVGITLRRVSF